MNKGNVRTVARRPDGTWENRRADASRASSVHDTQWAATEAARQMLRNQGGGRLVVKGADGRIRNRDSLPSRADRPSKKVDAKYHVLPSLSKGWVVTKESSSRALKTFDSKAKAEDWARHQVTRHGSTAIYIHDQDGLVQDRYFKGS